MSKKWIIISSKIGSRFLEYEGPGKKPKLVKSLENPDGRLKNSDLYSDTQGMAVSQGSGKFGMSGEQDAKQRIAEMFAREIADELEQARKAGSFSSLVTVAEPGFLGMILGHLDKKTSEMIFHKLNKDLFQKKDEEILDSLKSILYV